LIDVSPPWDNEFEDWARALASGKKKSITHDAIESLRENVGLSITNLAMEIEKLACLAGDEREINEKHIEVLLGRSKVETEFALADAVVSGNRALALTLLSDLLREGSAIPKIMWAFRRGYETVWRAKEMLEGGASSDSVVKALKMSKRQSGPVLNATRGFQADDLRKALGAIFDADVRMRSQKLDERIILEMLLLALCNLRAAE
jgi:DNA polymerase-3 subunit delta